MKVVELLSLQITATWPPEEVVITAVARVPLGSPPVGWYTPQKAVSYTHLTLPTNREV